MPLCWRLEVGQWQTALHGRAGFENPLHVKIDCFSCSCVFLENKSLSLYFGISQPFSTPTVSCSQTQIQLNIKQEANNVKFNIMSVSELPTSFCQLIVWFLKTLRTFLDVMSPPPPRCLQVFVPAYILQSLTWHSNVNLCSTQWKMGLTCNFSI